MWLWSVVRLWGHTLLATIQLGLSFAQAAYGAIRSFLTGSPSAVMSLLSSLPGMMLLAINALVGITLAALFVQFVLAFLDGSAAVTSLLATAVVYYLLYMYVNVPLVFQLLLLSGFVFGDVVLLALFPTVQDMADEGWCYVFRANSWLEFLAIGFGEWYDELIPLLNTITAWISDLAYGIIVDLWQPLLGFLGIVARLPTSTSSELGCLPVNSGCDGWEDALAFPCVPEQMYCASLEGVRFAVDDVFLRIAQTFLALGGTSSAPVLEAMRNIAWLIVDTPLSILELFAAASPSAGCSTSVSCEECSVAQETGPRCCPTHNAVCMIKRWTDLPAFLELLLELFKEIPGIGRIIEIMSMLSEILIGFANDFIIVPLNFALNLVLSAFTGAINPVLRAICAIVKLLDDACFGCTNVGSGSYCGWRISTPSNVIPLITGPIPGLSLGLDGLDALSGSRRMMLSIPTYGAHLLLDQWTPKHKVHWHSHEFVTRAIPHNKHSLRMMARAASREVPFVPPPWVPRHRPRTNSTLRVESPASRELSTLPILDSIEFLPGGSGYIVVLRRAMKGIIYYSRAAVSVMLRFVLLTLAPNLGLTPPPPPPGPSVSWFVCLWNWLVSIPAWVVGLDDPNARWYDVLWDWIKSIPNTLAGFTVDLGLGTLNLLGDFGDVDDIDLDASFAELDDWKHQMVDHLRIIGRAEEMLELIRTTILDWSFEAPTGPIAYIYDEYLECESPSSIHGITNPTGEWRLFCLARLQFPYRMAEIFPFFTLSDHILWNLECPGGYTNEGFIEDHIDLLGNPVMCRCRQYQSCGDFYRHGGALASSIVSGFIVWLGEVIQGGAIAAGALIIPIPLTIHDIFGPFIGIVPVIDQAIEIGLDSLTGKSLSTALFPSAEVAPIGAAPLACAIVRTPAITLDVIVMVSWFGLFISSAGILTQLTYLSFLLTLALLVYLLTLCCVCGDGLAMAVRDREEDATRRMAERGSLKSPLPPDVEAPEPTSWKTVRASSTMAPSLLGSTGNP